MSDNWHHPVPRKVRTRFPYTLIPAWSTVLGMNRGSFQFSYITVADVYFLLSRPKPLPVISHLDNKRFYNSPFWIHPPHWVRCKIHLHMQPKLMKIAYTHYWVYLMCLTPWYMLFLQYYIFITILEGTCYYL